VSAPHHCTPADIRFLLVDLDAIVACTEFPPLRDRDHRARAAVVAAVIRHLLHKQETLEQCLFQMQEAAKDLAGHLACHDTTKLAN
jgi:hypothetical protein